MFPRSNELEAREQGQKSSAFFQHACSARGDPIQKALPEVLIIPTQHAPSLASFRSRDTQFRPMSKEEHV